MKPIDVTSDFYAKYNEASNKKDPKFKVGDHVKTSKYKNIFAKWYTQNWSEEVFVVCKIKNTVLWTYAISDLNGEPITGSFYEKEFEKTSQENFRIEKVLKRKGDKLYVKWKGYDSRFNSWIIKKDLIIKMSSQYFPILSNYATKTDLKNVTQVDTSTFSTENKFG